MANESISNLPSLPSAVISTDLFLLSRANPPLVGGYTTYNASAAQLSAGLTLTPTITGGSINGTVIGNVSPAAGTFSTLTVTGAANFPGGLTLASINNTPIGNVTPSTGAFTTLSASSLSVVAINSTPIGPTIPSTGSFTTLAASGAVSGAGFTALFASPPTIGGIAPGAATFTTLAATTISGTPNFSGTPTFTNPVALGSSTATTQATTDSSTKLATTAFVQAAIGGGDLLAANNIWTGTNTFNNTVSGTGITSLFASPPPLGGTAPAAVAATTLSASTSLKVNVGTADAVHFGSGTANNGVSPVQISANSDLTIQSPPTGTLLHIIGGDGGSAPLLVLDAFGGAVPRFIARAAGASAAAPSAIATGISFFQFVGMGYDGSAYSGIGGSSAFLISAVASSTWTTSNHGTTVQFYNTADGAVARLELMSLDAITSSVTLGGGAGSESLRVPGVASAVNRLQISGATTGNPAIIAAAGSDTNVSINITPQAAGTTSITAGGLAVTGGVSTTASFTSTVAIGTPPLVVTSTTNVPNLNASSLSGATFTSPGPIGSSAASTGAFTTLSASSTVSGTGFSTYLASPPAIGGTTPAAGSFTALNSSGGLNVTANGAVIVGTVSLGGVAGAESLRAPAVASAVNRLSVSGSVTTQPVVVAALGTDANINLQINSKGTGLVQFGTASSFAANATTATLLGSLGPTGSHTTVQTWLTFFDSGGIQRWVPCF